MPADYDGAWKEFLELYFRPFLEFCFPRAASRVDWSQSVTFLDKELQEVVRDSELGVLRADKLVRVACLDGQEEWVLIHVEVQSQPDDGLAHRMYEYHRRINDRYGRAVVSMAVLADGRVGWKPDCYEEEHWGCRLRFEYLVCKLVELAPERLEQENNVAAVVIAAHLAAQRTAGDMPARKRLKWQLTRRLYEQGYEKKDVLEIFRLIDWLMALPEKLTVEFRRELVQYEQDNAMPYVTSIELLGRQEGRQEGQSQIVQRQLRRRCGELSKPVEQRLRSLSSQQLELLAESLLDFRSSADLEDWLERQDQK